MLVRLVLLFISLKVMAEAGSPLTEEQRSQAKQNYITIYTPPKAIEPENWMVYYGPEAGEPVADAKRHYTQTRAKDGLPPATASHDVDWFQYTPQDFSYSESDKPSDPNLFGY